MKVTLLKFMKVYEQDTLQIEEQIKGDKLNAM